MWYVYILRCGDGTLYTGSTNNLQRRLEAHREGKGAKYTRGRQPLVMVYNQEFSQRSQALKREAAVKKLSRTDKEKLIEQGQGGI